MSKCSEKQINKLKEANADKETLAFVSSYFDIKDMDKKGMLLDPEELDILQQVDEIADMSELSGRYGTAMVSMSSGLLSDIEYSEPRYRNGRVSIVEGKYNGSGKAKLLIRYRGSYFWVDKTELELNKSWDEVLANDPNEDMQGNFETLVEGAKINIVDDMNRAFDEVAEIDKQDVNIEELNYLKGVLNKVLNSGLRVIPEMNLYIDTQAANNGGFVDTSADKMGVYIKVNKEKPRTHSEMSASEVFVHEMVHAATTFAFNYNKGEVSRSIDRLVSLREEAMKVLKVEDLMPDVLVDEKVEREIAEARLEYMNKSLEEFLAYALTNKKVRDKIAGIKVYEREKPKKWADLVVYYVKKAIDAATMLWRQESKSTNGLNVAMSAMVAMAKAQNKARENGKRGVAEKLFEKVDDLESAFSDKQKAGMSKLASKYTGKVDYNTTGWKRAKEYGKLFIAAMDNDRSTGAFNTILSAMGMKPEGLVSTTIDTVRKGDELKNIAQELALQSVQIDEHREATAGKLAGMVIKGFKGKVTKQEKAVMQSGLQRVDASVLVDEDLKEMYSNDEARAHKVEELYEKIPTDKKNYYKYQVQGLAKYMVDGVGNEIQLRNAEAIVRGLGTQEANTSENVDGELIKVVDKLVTLEAVSLLSADTRRQVAELVEKDTEGVLDFLKLQQAIDNNLIAKMDFTERINRRKGYVRETYDKYTHATVVPMSEKVKMLSKGYKLERVFDKSVLDGSREELGLFVSNDLIQQPFNRQAVRFVGEKKEGISFYDTAMKSEGVSGWRGARESIKNNATISKRAMRLVQEGKSVNLEGKATPEFNSNGQIVDYRYNVSTDDKVRLLGLELNGPTALGRTVAHQVDVEESHKLNEIVWQELLVDMAKNKGVGRLSPVMHEYIEVSTDSNNEMVKDIARIMPKSFKDNLKLLNGEEVKDGMVSEGIAKALIGDRWNDLNIVEQAKLRARLADGKLYVRRDMLIPMFGARDISIVDVKGIDKLPTIVKTYIRKLENIWKEFVSLYKVGVIIKTIPVLVGNLISNFIVGVISGGNPIDTMNDSLKAWEELGIYKDRQEALIEAQADLVKTGNKKYQREIDRIKNDIESMAIYPLVKYGLYTQILEEVERDTTSNNRIVNFFDKKLENMPDIIQDGVSWLYMTDKTKAFQVMQSITAKSDFVARYAQYKTTMKIQNRRLEKEKKRKLTKAEYDKLEKEVLREIRDTYVNYTRPDHPIAQYANDMGLVLFTKYAIRMQRIIMNLVSGHPLRAAAAMAGQEIMFQTIGVEPDDVFEKSVLLHGTDILYSPDVMDMIEKTLTPHIYNAVKSVGDL